MESKKFLNADEVAAEFGVDADALKQFVDSGSLRALADRGTWKYRRDELEGLVSAGKIQPPSSDVIGSLADGNQTLSFDSSDEDVSYIELDEEALAEQATMITKSSSVKPAKADEPDWFVPSEEAEMKASSEQSSSDVAVYPDPTGEAKSEQSSSDVAIYNGPEGEPPAAEDSPAIAAGSDSDVQIAPDYNVSRPEDSGILLDFNPDAGATVSSSGSSLRLPETTPGAAAEIGASGVEDDAAAWDEIPTAAVAGSSDITGDGGDGSGINFGSGPGESSLAMGGSSITLGGDSAVNLVDVTGSDVKLPTEESGILLGEGSELGMSAGSSVLAQGQGDSGITLDAGKPDSGITLEGPRKAIDDDSGISMVSDDSGISMSAGDSGLALGSLDSGLSLHGAESGITLSGDSGIAVQGNARTLADDDLQINLGDKTQSLDLTGEFEDDSSFEINLDGGDATAELLLGDDDDADEASATVVRRGRPAPGSLSAAFELDEPGEVEDLEISQDLDASIEDDVGELSDDDEEVFEASEETFSGDEVEATGDDEGYLEPAAASKKAVGPREPAWGVGMTVGLVACSLFLAANSLVVWAGVSTMWNGADAEGPAASLISSLGDLIK